MVNNKNIRKEKIILSIDPGYERLGICVLQKNIVTKKIEILHSECFKTSSKGSVTISTFINCPL